MKFVVFFDTYYIDLEVDPEEDVRIGDFLIAVIQKLHLEPDQIVCMVHDRGILGKDISFDEQMERLFYNPVIYVIINHFRDLDIPYEGTYGLFVEWLDHRINHEEMCPHCLEEQDANSQIQAAQAMRATQTRNAVRAQPQAQPQAQAQPQVQAQARPKRGKRRRLIRRKVRKNSSAKIKREDKEEPTLESVTETEDDGDDVTYESESEHVCPDCVEKMAHDEDEESETSDEEEEFNRSLGQMTDILSSMFPYASNSNQPGQTAAVPNHTPGQSGPRRAGLRPMGTGPRPMGAPRSMGSNPNPSSNMNIDSLLSSLGLGGGGSRRTFTTTTTSPDGNEIRQSMVSFEIGGSPGDIPLQNLGSSSAPSSVHSAHSGHSAHVGASNPVGMSPSSANIMGSMMSLFNVLNQISGQSPFDSFMNLLDNLEDVPVTLDVETVDKLPVFKYKDLKDNVSQLSDPSDKCSICLEEFQDDDDLRVLFCKHFYHTGCIDTWLTEHNTTCPLCRSDTRDEGPAKKDAEEHPEEDNVESKDETPPGQSGPTVVPSTVDKNDSNREENVSSKEE